MLHPVAQHPWATSRPTAVRSPSRRAPQGSPTPRRSPAPYWSGPKASCQSFLEHLQSSLGRSNSTAKAERHPVVCATAGTDCPDSITTVFRGKAARGGGAAAALFSPGCCGSDGGGLWWVPLATPGVWCGSVLSVGLHQHQCRREGIPPPLRAVPHGRTGRRSSWPRRRRRRVWRTDQRPTAGTGH